MLRLGTQDVPATRACLNLAKRFEAHGESYFRFITTPGVGPTNNLAEQAIRFVVIDRLITQGTRSERGNRWCERIWTVMATCVQQGRSVFAYLEAAVTAWFHGDEAPSLLPQRELGPDERAGRLSPQVQGPPGPGSLQVERRREHPFAVPGEILRRGDDGEKTVARIVDAQPSVNVPVRATPEYKHLQLHCERLRKQHGSCVGCSMRQLLVDPDNSPRSCSTNNLCR